MQPQFRDSVAVPSSAPASSFQNWFARLVPGPVGIDGREGWRAVAGAAAGILFAALLSRALAHGGPAAAWLVAPLGATAVLVFALPASPLAQPWAVVAGNTLSALVGVFCARVLNDPALGACVAVAASIALMLRLRCLHPPSGAAAALMVITHTTQFRFALFPVLLNSLLLVLAGVVYNSLTGKSYPRAQRTAPPPGLRPVGGRRFSEADLDAALAHYNQVVDISRDDLQDLLEHAEMAAYQRRLGALRCGEVMTREPVSVLFGASLQEAWDVMRERRIKALPVVDRGGRLAGIVTMMDFMRLADASRHDGLGQRLHRMLRASGLTHDDRPEVVGQIMTRQLRVASEERPLADLVPVFAEDNHHHIPIVDGERRLVGMITQTDLMRALYRAAV